ncbi:MAG: VCBS repeat-containing protein [Pseudomonadota bacterium]
MRALLLAAALAGLAAAPAAAACRVDGHVICGPATAPGDTVQPLAAPQDTPGQNAVVFTRPTTRYPHGVLGDTTEYGGILFLAPTAAQLSVELVLPEVRVFEDLAPRRVDFDGDGRTDVVVVEAHAAQGARLAVYSARGLVAATEWIGTRFRWLAPVGIADFDGDGALDIAYVDRPHLAKVLRVVTRSSDRLVPLSAKPGFSNHRIGENFISSAVRLCGGRAEMVVPGAAWQRLFAVRLDAGALVARDLGVFSPSALRAAAKRC